MSLLVIGIVLFLGIHSIRIVAEPLRERLVNRFGILGFKSIYAIVSLLGLVLIVIGYGQARLSPVLLYQPPAFLQHVTMLLMLIVFPALLASHLPGRVQSTLKHPLLVATKAWALSHLLVNGMLADVILFGAFLAWAVIDRISIARRSTPSVSPQLPDSRFNDLIVIVGGLGLYLAFVFWLHPILIGVPAVA